MEIPSGLTLNSLIWLTAPRPDDEGWTARIRPIGDYAFIQKAHQSVISALRFSSASPR